MTPSNLSMALAATLVIAIATLTAGPPAQGAPAGKKIYISADIEGISGVIGDDQTSSSGAEYGRAPGCRVLRPGDGNARGA